MVPSQAVRALTVPRVDADSPDGGMRDSDTKGSGFLPAETGFIADDCLLVLGTDQDDAAAWLAAGVALEHVLLEITRLGYAASPLSQVTEDPSARAELRRMLVRLVYPQALLRVGLAPTASGSSRRPLFAVLTRLDAQSTGSALRGALAPGGCHGLAEVGEPLLEDAMQGR